MKVQLGQYKGFDIERPDIEVNHEDCVDFINQIREKFQISKEKEAPVEAGDHITIDFDGYHRGQFIQELSRKNYHSKVGAGFFAEDFEKQLMGARKGDVLEIEMRLPEDFDQVHLRHEEVTYKVKVLAVTRRETPPLSDDVVKTFKLEGVQTLDELHQYADRVVRRKKMVEKSAAIINEIVGRIIEGAEVTLDADEVDRLKNEIFDDFVKTLVAQQASLALYLKYAEKSEEQLRQECEIEAMTYLTEKAVIEKIAEMEKIETVDDSQMDQEQRDQILYQKVIAFILEANTIVA